MHRQLTLTIPEVGPLGNENLVRLPRIEYTAAKASLLFQVGHIFGGDYIVFRQVPVEIQDTTGSPTAYTSIFNDFDVKNRENRILDYIVTNGYISGGVKSDQP